MGAGGLAVCASPAPAAAAAGAAGEAQTPSIAALPSFVYDAHRGGSLEARENSLSGLDRVLASGAVEVLDLDTQELRDGTVVLMHDSTVDRTTSSTGAVSRYTSATWGDVRLDTGAWLRPAPAPEPAPTLDAALARYGGRVVMTVEAKNPASVPVIAAMLRRRKLTESVYVNTNSPEVARAIHATGLHAHLWRSAGQMRADVPARWAPYVDLLDVDVLGTDAQIRAAVQSGIPRVWAHTLTSRPQRDRIRRLGVGGVITDDPSYLLGRTSRYPASPTVVAVRRPPTTVQVGDLSSVVLGVSATSSNPIAGAAVTGLGRGVTGRARTGRRALVLPLSTAGAPAGRQLLRIAVLAGHDAEGRTWPAAATSTPITLAPEDLALSTAVTSGSSRAVSVRVDTRDSASGAYAGPRKEHGALRTVLGLGRATIALSVHAGTSASGRTLTTMSRPGLDTGIAGNGDGHLTFTWRAPGPGRYTVVARQTGPSYTHVQASAPFTVR